MLERVIRIRSRGRSRDQCNHMIAQKFRSCLLLLLTNDGGLKLQVALVCWNDGAATGDLDMQGEGEEDRPDRAMTCA